MESFKEKKKKKRPFGDRGSLEPLRLKKKNKF